MNTVIKALLPVAFAAATSSVFAVDPTSYVIENVAGGEKLLVNVQGAGALTLDNKAAITMGAPAGATVNQRLTLASDNTFSGDIFFNVSGSEMPVFHLTGSWYRPTGSKVIYFAVDGDPTKGGNSDGTYGALFNADKATMAPFQAFIPMLYPGKLSAVEPIFPTTMLKVGQIKLTLDKSGAITGAMSTMTITGRAMVTYTKTSLTKDAAYSFSSITKATVTAPAPM